MTNRQYGDTAIRRTDKSGNRPIAGSLHRRFGILGGTFNPIHNGHLQMAEAAKKQFKLDVVYFIPCGIPPHKSHTKMLPAKLRYRLVKEAIRELNKTTNRRYGVSAKKYEVLDIEIKKKKPCYTIDTIKELLKRAGEPANRRIGKRVPRRLADPPHRRFFFLIGQDEFEKLHTWKKPNELAKLVTFLVLPRSLKKIKPPKIKNLQWLPVHTKLIDISSTKIRENIKFK